eukprot:UN2766
MSKRGGSPEGERPELSYRARDRYRAGALIQVQLLDRRRGAGARPSEADSARAIYRISAKSAGSSSMDMPRTSW